MKRNVLILFLFVYYLVAGQNSKIDSLQSLLSNHNNSNQELIRIHLKLYGLKKNNNESAYQHLILADELVNVKTDNSIQLKINIDRSTHHLFSGNYDSVFFYVDKKKITDSIQFSKELIAILTNKGLAEYYKSKYNKAITNYIKAAEISEKNGIDSEIAQVYNNIGIAYIKLENWEKAAEYMLKSLSICKKFNLKRGISYTLGNLGIIYKNLGKYDKAIAMYEESLVISKELNDDRAILRTNTSIGGLYQENKRLNQALNYYEKSLKKAEQLGDRQSVSANLINISSVYIDRHDFKIAKKYLEKALSISNEIGILDHMMDIYKKLASVYEMEGKHDLALESYKNFEKIKDSIFNREKLESLNDIEAKYQTEKKDKELAKQKLILEQQTSELQKKRSQYSLMTGLAIFLLLTSVLTWFLYQQRQKRKNQEILTLKREQQVKTLESLMEGEEKERIRIAKELHDGVNVDLSAIKYKLTSLLEKNNKVINEAVIMIDKSCEQVRAISHNLVSPSLENFSLIEAIADYCSTMNSIHKPEIFFQYLGDPISIFKKAEVNIFRIVQELVNNSIKHAKATEIDVQISHRENFIQLTIEDNGTGFEKEKIEGNGIGLQNIKSRVAYLNAKLDFNSDKEGTSYNIDINTNSLS